jgi:hypothetical protein
MRNLILIIFFVTFSFANEVAGIISKLRGSALILRGETTLVAKKKMEIFSKDMIITQGRTKVKLKFADNTLITVGQNSVFEVENYLFKKEKSQARFKVRHGIFNAVSGKISKLARKNFKLRIKTATIGVRGTVFSGEVSDTKETVACEKGSIEVAAKGKIIVVHEGESLEVKPELFEEPEPIKTIGNIFKYSGGVFLVRNKKTLMISNGTELQNGDILATGNYGKISLKLITGEKIFLKELAQTQIFLNSVKGKVAVMRGRIKLKNIKKQNLLLKYGELIELHNGLFFGKKRKITKQDNIGYHWNKKN